MKKYSSIKKGSYRPTLLVRYGVLVFIILVVLVASGFLLPRIARFTAGLFWMPLDAVRVWVAESESSLPQYLRDRSSLIDQLDSLKRQIATSQADENTMRKLQVENNNFRTLLDAKPTERLLARVVVRPNQLPYDMLMIDRGTNDGVTKNAPVFFGKDKVIGIITRVHPNTALVTLVSTPGFRATAYILGPNIYTYAEGMGDGIVRVRVPQGIELSKNDLVILPAVDSGVYGTIVDTSTSPTQPEQYGYVTMSTPLQSLEYVTVGHDPVMTNSFASADKLVKAIMSDMFKVTVPPSLLVTPETLTETDTASSISTSTSIQ